MRRFAPIVLALLLPVAFLTGFAARGGWSTGKPAGAAPLPVADPQDNSPEAGFVRDMIVHHAQAVDMAERIRARTTDSALRLLSTDIVLTQQHQIGRFQGWLEQWNLSPSSTNAPMAWMTYLGPPDQTPDSAGVSTTTASMAAMGTMDHPSVETGVAKLDAMPGMAARGDVNSLSIRPLAEAERSFLELMIRHHKGGVAMANGVLTRTERLEVTRIAKSIVTSQTGEIIAMRQLLSNRESGSK